MKKELKSKKTAKPARKKTAKKPLAKTKVKTKKKPIKEIKKPKKQAKAKKEVKKTAKKTAVKKPVKKIKEKAKKITPRKKITKASGIETAGEKEPKKIAMPGKKVVKLPARTLWAIETKPENIYKDVSKIGLPAEYGENRITLMTVDPWKLFAYWEVRGSTLAKLKGKLVLRVYDVTGIYFDGRNANIAFDILVHERVGDSYIGVGPDRDFIVDIGIVSREGSFTVIARSARATTPVLKAAAEEGTAPEETYGISHAVGYF
ncbi:MAG: DUF4912 domain-containing protein [Nitrospirae bacterium]|nr:DUF4912 domain-containing protein [Nitrospirota bacterium]